MSRKQWMITLGLVGAAIVAYVAYRWWQSRSSSNEARPPVGTNLNSVAPELIAGPTAGGTDVQPAVSTPINITLNDSYTGPPPGNPGTAMVGVANTTSGPLNGVGGATAGQLPSDTDMSTVPADATDLTESS